MRCASGQTNTLITILLFPTESEANINLFSLLVRERKRERERERETAACSYSIDVSRRSLPENGQRGNGIEASVKPINQKLVE